MARPTKYTDAKAQQIADLLRDGCTRKDAYGSVGIDPTTFASWLERFPHFSQLVEAAEADAAVRMTQTLSTAAITDWKAALEWLKRRRRDDWGDSLSLTKIDDDTLVREAADILKRSGSGGSAGSSPAGPDASAGAGK